jgi:16S rRNA (guanine527-N7)-methyltransferase
LNESDAAARLDVAMEVLRRATASDADLPVLDARQMQRVRVYLEMLLLWRRRISLIATSDPLLVVENHILDSLHLAPYVSDRQRLADIGSGAGLPGVPLAIAVPHLKVVLVESRRKRTSFLRAVRRQVDLPNVEVLEGRAEGLTEKFDVVVSRALGPVGAFLDLAQALLPAGGLAVAMKAAGASHPNHEAFQIPRAIAYDLAHDRSRVLVLYDRR